MTQFKDKSQQVAEKDKDAFISTGIFNYPILQAADILIYKADYVPVGKTRNNISSSPAILPNALINWLGKNILFCHKCCPQKHLKFFPLLILLKR
jgi:tryptophanyl-tRNA synthetase